MSTQKDLTMQEGSSIADKKCLVAHYLSRRYIAAMTHNLQYVGPAVQKQKLEILLIIYYTWILTCIASCFRFPHKVPNIKSKVFFWNILHLCNYHYRPLKNIVTREGSRHVIVASPWSWWRSLQTETKVNQKHAHGDVFCVEWSPSAPLCKLMKYITPFELHDMVSSYSCYIDTNLLVL